MSEKFKAQAGQIAFIFIVFLLFLCNGTGILEIQFQHNAGLSFHSLLSSPVNGHNVAMPAILYSLEFMLLLLSGTVLSLFLPVLNPVKASVLTAVCAIVPIYPAYTSSANSLLPLEFSLLTILILYAINVLVSYFRETMAKQKLVDVFGQFIPPELVAEISRNPGQLNLDGESKHMTVFFCDLQNFTGVSEQLNPKQLAKLLNEYFTAMTEILFSHGATIDKYIGDSIMAFWSAPISQEDHAKRAVLSALQMQKDMSKLSDEFVNRGWPALAMGIGINTGRMNVGNMGSKYRISYTVVGDAVNLASRLEGLTRNYQVATIVSETTMQESDGILYRALDLVQVKGKRNRTKIYEPVCIATEAEQKLRNKIDTHNQAMEYYFAEDWGKAEDALGKLRQEFPQENLYTVLLDKIALKS